MQTPVLPIASSTSVVVWLAPLFSYVGLFGEIVEPEEMIHQDQYASDDECRRGQWNDWPTGCNILRVNNVAYDGEE